MVPDLYESQFSHLKKGGNNNLPHMFVRIKCNNVCKALNTGPDTKEHSRNGNCWYLHTLSHLGKQCYTHFIDEELEALRSQSNLFKAI